MNREGQERAQAREVERRADMARAKQALRPSVGARRANTLTVSQSEDGGDSSDGAPYATRTGRDYPKSYSPTAVYSLVAEVAAKRLSPAATLSFLAGLRERLGLR